nr:hypothetical protein [Tanacetum cinerariifolium]
MVAYMEKIKENAQFHEIVDLLSRSSIFYALTVSPDVCASFIEQFCKTATFKTISNISQIHAKVAGKPVVITEASIRGDLLFNDVDGIDCLTNEAIFENLALMGYEGDLTKLTFQKALFSPQLKFLIHTIIHCLSKITPLFPSMLTQAAVAEGEDSGTPTESQPTPSPTKPKGTGGSGRDQVNLPHDSPLSDAQAKEILTLKARIKKLEKRCKPSISHHQAWLRSVSLFSKKKKLNEDIEYMDTEEALNEGRQSTVSTARPDVNTLIKLKDDKAKGVAFKDSESTDKLARSILTLKPVPIIDPKDKGKGVLEEPESAKKMTKSDFDSSQIARDEEIARQAKLLAEYFERRKNELAEERAVAIRKKPPTKTQLRRLMMTYLKNMGRFTHSQLNKKSFEDILGLYLKEQELIADFFPIRSEEDERMIKDMNKKVKEESSDKGVDNTKKRKKDQG